MQFDVDNKNQKTNINVLSLKTENGRISLHQQYKFLQSNNFRNHFILLMAFFQHASHIMQAVETEILVRTVLTE